MCRLIYLWDMKSSLICKFYRDVLHCKHMIKYEAKINKLIKKGKIPIEIFKHIHNAFVAIDKTGDLQLFDIKRLKTNLKREYYRLRKGNYRAIFYFEKDDIFIIALDKRDEVYRKWQ